MPLLWHRAGTARQRHRDPAVREALWGIAPTFPQNTTFYLEIQEVVAVRNSQPALRYGRFYFRPISGDSVNFGISPFPSGVLAWSRILNDQEVLIVANTNTTQSQSVDVILEITLSKPGDTLRVLYSNNRRPLPRLRSRLSTRSRSLKWMERREQARSTWFALPCNRWRRKSCESEHGAVRTFHTDAGAANLVHEALFFEAVFWLEHS